MVSRGRADLLRIDRLFDDVEPMLAPLSGKTVKGAFDETDHAT